MSPPGRACSLLRKAAALLIVLTLASACAGTPVRGARAQDPFALTLRSTDGEFVELARFKGEVLLLTFFATWCFPCLVEVPHLQALQRDFADRGFSVVAIGMDLEGAKVLRPFAATLETPYPVLIADDEVREGRSPFGSIRVLPTTYLFDRSGRLVGGFTGPVAPEQMRKLVERLTR